MSRLKEALQILQDATYEKPISARGFANKFWPKNLMHETCKNTGNGACHGKAAWLCAGSYMGKLIKKQLVTRGQNFRGYYLTFKGKEKLLEL